MSNLHFTKRHLFILFVFILNIFVLSCKNVDIDPKQQNNESRIASTKQWFEKKVLNVPAARKNGGFALDDVEIDWENVKINEAKSGKDYFMIPLKHHLFIDVSSGHEVKTPPMKLIIREDEKGEKVAYVLQVIPDDDLEEAKKKPFSGTVRMTTWKGALVKGWKIKNGKVTKRFTSKNTLNIIKNGRTAYGEIPDCIEETYTDYVFECFFSAVVTCPISRPPFQEIKVYGSYFYNYDKNGCTSPPSMYFSGCSSPEWDLVEENDYSLSYIITTCDGINSDEWAGYESFEEYSCEMYGTYCNLPPYEPSCGYGFIKDAYGNCIYCPNGGRCGDNTTPEVDVDIINNVTNPCLSSVVNTFLQNPHGINNLIQNIFSCNDDVNLKFANDNLVGLEGKTTVEHANPERTIFDVLITIDNKQALYSKEYIASTVIHEALHAYMNYTGKPINGDRQHLAMGEQYLNLMSSYLQVNYGMTKKNADVLALGGLENYTWFNEVRDKNNISDNEYWTIKGNYKDNTNKTSGTYCQ